MDQELVICKICKKVFRDVQGLNQHKMQLHSQPQRQQSSIQATSTNNHKDSFVSHQFRNNSNISITRICKPETNQNSAIVSQSSMNQNSFRKTSASPSITVRRQEMKTKQTEGSRVKAPFRSPGVKGGQASVKSMVLGQLDVEADTTDKWQKWEPQVPKPAPSAALTISKSAAEVAASAATTARKSVPPLHPLHPVPGGKRPVAGMNKVGSGAAVGRGAAGNSVVTDIMQNLGKIKSLNQQQRPAPPKQKLISLAPAKKGPALPLPQVQKKLVKQGPRMQAQPAPIPKNKMKAAPINNALPKANAAQASRKLMMEEVEDSSDLQEEETDTELDLEPYVPQLPPKKATSPAKGKASAGGKAPPPSKSLNTNRFNPIESPKKAKGKAAAASTTITPSPKGSPNGKSKAGASAAASSSNGTNKLTPAAPSSVVGKKSNPSHDAKGGKKKKKLDQVGKLKQLVPTMAGTEYEMPKLSAIGSYTNRAGHQVWVCLVCNEKEHEESSRDMICCEMCDDWYHWECVGIRQAPEEEDDWYCKRCIYQVVPNAKKVFPRIFRDDILD